MDEKNNLLENCLELFSLNKIDRDIFSWTGKNVAGQEFLEVKSWLNLDSSI